MKNQNIRTCGVNGIYPNTLEKVKESIPSDTTLEKLANLFKVIGDKTRVKILHSISENELCVCDIAEVLEMSDSAISHQLRVLKEAKIVKNIRIGKNVFYSLDDLHIKEIFSFGLIHINEIKQEGK